MSFKNKFYILVSLLFLVSACSDYKSNLAALGKNSDFSDVEIDDDFGDSEDDDTDIIDDGSSGGTQVIQTKNTFDMGTRLFQLANGSAYQWQGCNKEKSSQGGYDSDTKCGRGYFHPLFADNLNEIFYQCVISAAKLARYPAPTRVFIRHLGTYNDRNARNSSRKSNHAYARAWDIVNFNLFDKNGNRYKVSTYKKDYKGQQAEFYDEFRDCWKDSLPANCRAGKSEYKGSIGHTSSKLGGNSLHNDHMHLSYPLCAG